MDKSNDPIFLLAKDDGLNHAHPSKHQNTDINKKERKKERKKETKKKKKRRRRGRKKKKENPTNQKETIK